MNIISGSTIPFLCKQNSETWIGSVTYLFNHGSHYEIHLQSRSSIQFMIGKYANGAFISIPAFNAGADLASFSDYFWNCERLCLSINTVDAITIAECIRTLHKAGYIK